MSISRGDAKRRETLAHITVYVHRTTYGTTPTSFVQRTNQNLTGVLVTQQNNGRPITRCSSQEVTKIRENKIERRGLSLLLVSWFTQHSWSIFPLWLFRVALPFPNNNKHNNNLLPCHHPSSKRNGRSRKRCRRNDGAIVTLSNEQRP